MDAPGDESGESLPGWTHNVGSFINISKRDS
jgi:hypothetical protein